MVLGLPCLPHIEAEAEALQYCAPWRVMASYRKSQARRMNASRLAYWVYWPESGRVMSPGTAAMVGPGQWWHVAGQHSISWRGPVH